MLSYFKYSLPIAFPFGTSSFSWIHVVLKCKWILTTLDFHNVFIYSWIIFFPLFLLRNEIKIVCSSIHIKFLIQKKFLKFNSCCYWSMNEYSCIVEHQHYISKIYSIIVESFFLNKIKLCLIVWEDETIKWVYWLKGWYMFNRNLNP
jgi:hypothetical protein